MDLGYLLGSGVPTLASVLDDGYLFFDDPYLAVARSLSWRNYRMERYEIEPDRPWHGLLDALLSGRSVAVVLDAYHLPHFSAEYRRSHLTHTVVMRDIDPSTSTVEVRDLTERSLFTGRVPLDVLEPAMVDDNCAHAWMVIEGVGPMDPPDGPTQGELLEHVVDLTAGGGPWLDGVQLVRVLKATLDRHLSLLHGRCSPVLTPLGEDPQRRANCIKLGIWTYHNNIRWYARYIESLSRFPEIEVDADLPMSIRRLAQKILLLRALIERRPRDDAAYERIYSRLDSSLDSCHELMLAIGSAVGEIAKKVASARRPPTFRQDQAIM